MSTQFTNRQWRLPNNENKAKQSNYSMDFDSASSDKITGTGALISGNEPRSFSLWYKTTTSTPMIPFSLGNPDSTLGGTNTQFAYCINRQNSTTRAAIFGRGNDVSPITVPATNDGNWHHLVVTYDQVSLKVYIDGSLEANPSLPSSNYSTNNGFSIGGWSVVNDRKFNGQIDGVSVFGYALSSSQVTTLYGSSSTGIGNPMTLNPVAYYPLGDQDAFNGANYLVPNSSLKDYVFDFDAANDYIDLGNLQPSTTSLSISAWAYKTDATNASIIGRGASVDYGIFTYSGSLVFGLNSGSWSTIAISNFTSNYLNQWFHVCATWDGSTMKLYLNGNEEASASKTGTITYTSNDTTIGKNSTLSGFEWDGKISNVQTFNTALPATGSNSVETLYNNGSPLTSMSGFTSLQGWWKLDASATYDGSNWTIPDDSTNSNDGTSSGMTQANLVQSDLSFTSGYSPYALDFDAASSDYINVPNSTDFDFGTADFTWSFWLNYETHANNAGILYTGANSSHYRLKFRYSGQIIFLQNSQSDTQIADLGTNIEGTGWHHIALVRNSGTITTFLDGSQVDSSVRAGDINSGGNDFRIAYSNVYLNGQMSNVSIWNAALTSAQVTEIYSEGVPSNLNNHSAYSNLVSWWQLGSNSSFNTNWTVLDEKGTNNGESVNMTEDDIVDGVGSYANGLSSGMGGDEVIGDAPYSSSNSLSVNMDVLDRVTDTPS